MPPPVDPGEAPIHISNIIRNITGTWTTEKSIELNPAVRDVTDKKSDCINLSKVEEYATTLLSKIKIINAPPKINKKVVINMILLDVLIFFDFLKGFLKISDIVKNPKPPKTINDIIIVRKYKELKIRFIKNVIKW